MLAGNGPALGPVEEVVTYHDPCDLGRKSEVYDAPRELMALIPGLELREMSACREHALCWKLRQSPRLTDLFCAPGNPGIATVADRVPIGVDTPADLARARQMMIEKDDRTG